MQKTKNIDHIRIQILGVVLLLPKVLEFLDSCFHLSASAITIGLYVGVLAFSILKCKSIKISNIAILMITYTIFAFNYLFFESTRKYMLEQDMLLIYFFFVPIGVFIFKEIHSWDNYEKILYPFSVIAVLLNTLVFVLGERDILSYMEVSYSLLPFLTILYSCARIAASRILSPILFIAGTVEIFAFGARGPILFLLIFIFLYEMLRTDAAGYKKVFLFAGGVSLISIISLFSDSIIESLSRMKIFENSYIIQNLSSGNFLQHKTRTAISQQCLMRIKSMGMEVSGFFGDRYYCGSVYPHNIIYELLMSLGWILGGLAILLLLILILRALFKKEDRMIVVFLTTTLFLRFFVSGSYLIEGKFWIFFFALMSLQYKKTEATVNEERVK